ncbi:MAG: hypothetical protein DRP81_07645 [Candidatus Omnitrophota bacterium]|nr:MAG: hypothetical protein DRP81_07645 [Candidatus Omnitrophota bacterium]
MKSSKKKTTRITKSRIEYQELIKEVRSKSYEVVRLSRIKYIGNDYYFIDIRFYQRGYNDDGSETYFPTKKGVQIKEDLFYKLFDEYFFNKLGKQFKT